MNIKKVCFYQVEGFEKYDKRTDTYTEIRKMEIIAETEAEALKLAQERIECKNYMVIGCFERFLATEFTDKEKADAIGMLLRLSLKQ